MKNIYIMYATQKLDNVVFCLNFWVFEQNRMHRTKTTLSVAHFQSKHRTRNMTTSKELNTLLLKACDIGFTNAVSTLLLLGPAVNINYKHLKDSRSGYNKGLVPLHVAARSGHADTVKQLLAVGSTKTASSKGNDNDDDETPKTTTITTVSSEIEVSVPDAEEWNALHYAAFSGHAQIVKLLVETGKFDLNLITLFEKATAQGFAEHRKFRECVRVLSDKNVDNNKLFVWTVDETEENLTRCVKKLKKTFPSKETGIFLFRYEMMLESYKKLEGFLQSFLAVGVGATSPKPYLILDAADHLLPRPEFEKLLEMENTTTHSTEIAITEAKADEIIDPYVASIWAELFSSAEFSTTTSTGTSFVPVKLLFHVDFEKHKCVANAFHMAKNKTLFGKFGNWRFLRASSINGLEHFIVVVKI